MATKKPTRKGSSKKSASKAARGSKLAPAVIKKPSHEWMRGCATALVTPFRHGPYYRAGLLNDVDDERLPALVERQCKAGVKILVPCGTTGESVTMSVAENALVIRTTVEVAQRYGARVIAGAGSNSTVHAVENAWRARDAGAHAVLVVAPYYNKPTQEGLYEHFATVASAVRPLPVVLYNVPGRTSSNISAETTLQLAHDFENIAAVKEASGDLAQIMEILRNRPRNFLVLSGDDALTLAMMALGADGLISVASNEAPGLMSRMVDAALDGRWDDARKLHYQLLPLMNVNFVESSPGPVKAAMAMMGLLEEKLRLPLVPVTDKTRERVREVLVEVGLLKEKAHGTA